MAIKKKEETEIKHREKTEPIEDYIGEEAESDQLIKAYELHRQQGPEGVIITGSDHEITLMSESEQLRCERYLKYFTDRMTRGQRQADVAKFHAKACVVPDPTTPTVPDQQTAFLRFNLIREELVELAQAMGITLDEQLRPKYFHPAQFNMIEAIDALVDIDYVTNGAYCALGVNSTPFWVAVHENNMTKFVDGWRDETGKYRKGPSYVPVNLKKVYEDVYGK